MSSLTAPLVVVALVVLALVVIWLLGRLSPGDRLRLRRGSLVARGLSEGGRRAARRLSEGGRREARRLSQRTRGNYSGGVGGQEEMQGESRERER